MTNDFEKKLMLKFLEKNYPVSRIKLHHHFKRAIVLDNGGAFILSDSNQIQSLRYQLSDTLKKVFSCDEAISLAVLDNFLRLT
jgi:hypothetical protein